MAAKKQQLIIWGAGGHASVVADIIRQDGTHDIAAFVDDVTERSRGSKFLGVPILRKRAELRRIQRTGVRQVIVAVGDCAARLELAERAKSMGFRLCPAMIHPRATVASSARLGAGTVIMAGAVVNPNATLGENVVVNTCASVDHDCVLEDGVHLCPGSHLAGNVTIGRGAWVGIGAAVVERVRIGKGAFIGAGAVVIRDIPDRVLARGVPARVIRKLQARRNNA